MSGYALIHRRLLGHHAFRNDAEAMAFGWMVIRASWKATRVRYKDRILNLDRGQLAVSVRDMANAMDRDKAWVERLWKRLKTETMIETVTEKGVTVVTICNYSTYQSSPTEVETRRETRGEIDARQTRDTEQRREIREEDKLDVDGGDARARDADQPDFPTDLIEAADAVCRTAGIRHVEPRAILDHQRLVKEWLADGFGLETIIVPVIRQEVSNATERISSLRYFDKPIRQHAARLEAQSHGYQPRNRHDRQPDLRGSRPDPSLDLYHAACAAEEAERAAGGGEDHRGAWPSLPSVATG